MKIGILTFWKTEDNYGQLLQCFATQAFLRSLGHEPFLVCASNGTEYVSTFKSQVYDKIRTAYRLRKYPWYFFKRVVGSAVYTLTHFKLRQHTPVRGFGEFREGELNCTGIYYLDDLKNDPPEAEAYFVGSDQIWNTTDGIYFLSWAPDHVKKISIAASFGARESSPEFINLISPWLKRFDLITVREQGGLEICKNAGINDAYLVPDPTLLLSADEYQPIMSPKYPDKPYLFIYFLGTRTNIDWKQIHQFAKEKRLDIVYVGSQGQEDKFKKIEPTIGEWLSLIAHCDYFLTNSFHGTVFGLQFNKPFMVYPVEGVAVKMNNRLTTLLTPLGLTDHIYRESLSPLDSEINYRTVSDIIMNNADRAKELLYKSLTSTSC